MARRGYCRCGTLLRFKRTALGYKTRCPSCQAIVRLRIDGDRNNHKRRADIPALPLTEADFSVPSGPVRPPAIPASTEPVDLSVLSTHDSNAPAALVEMEAYREPQPLPASARAHWWLLGLAIGAVVLVVGTAAVFLS